MASPKLPSSPSPSSSRSKKKHYLHLREHKKEVSLRTRSFKPQSVLDISIFQWFSSIPFSRVYIQMLVWVSGRIDPSLLDLGTRWRWVVNFMPQLLYTQRKNLQYPLDSRLGGPRGAVLTTWKRENSCPPETQTLTLFWSNLQPIAIL
jgi:hypothetical protein